jgi:hypothetical protein
MLTVADYKEALKLATRNLRAFEAKLRKLGGSYRDETGNYNPKLYEQHLRLAEIREGIARTLKSQQQQARWRKAGKI